MDMAEQNRLPTDVDAQPVVQAAVLMQSELRRYQKEIEQEQRFPQTLVDRMKEAGFYRLMIPHSLGGLHADPLTYLRVVELMAEGCGSVGWNLANNGVVQLVSLGLPDEGVHELYAQGASTVVAGTALQGGGQAIPAEGGYRVTGRWSFGSGSPEATWMLGSFQILDNGKPRSGADGKPAYWRGYFSRAEVEIVSGSWDVTGLRGTGSFDWTVDNLFLPERRTMFHAGAPLDNQWERWPGVTYQLPTQCWIGPHHSAVITGIARAGINALIELAGGKTPRGRTFMLCDNPQVQDAVGRADAILNAGRAYRTAMITELWNTVAAGENTTLEQRARCRLASTYAADSARGDGPDVPLRRQHLVQAGEPLGRMLARPPNGWPDGDLGAGVVPDRRPGIPGVGPGPAPALAGHHRMERVLLGGARAGNRGCGASALEAARAIVDEDPLRTYTVRRWTVNGGSYTVKVNYSDQSVTID